MERLQKIIAKLEAKIKPLYDENHLLKVKLEELQLDHELALEQIKELEAPDSKSRINELAQQVEALEMLKKLSDELEQDQREEITRLEVQVADLRDELQTAHVAAPNDSSDALQQQLSFLRLELEAARYDLKAHKQGVLDVLRESSDFDLEKMRYFLAVYGTDTDNDRVQSLFDMFKHGKVGARDISETLGELLAQFEARAQNNPVFNAELARKYLFNTTKDERVHNLSDTDIARALDDPTLVNELIIANNELNTSIDPASHSAEPAPQAQQSDFLKSQESESNSESEILNFKIKVLSEKAARAAHFASLLEQAKKNAKETSLQTEKLSKHIEQLTEKLQATEGQVMILKASQAPDLDTVTFQHTLGLLSDTIKLLHKKDPPFRLTPLEVSTGHSLSVFAGSPIVKQVWDAIDTFKPPTNRRAHIEQIRKLSLIDA